MKTIAIDIKGIKISLTDFQGQLSNIAVCSENPNIDIEREFFGENVDIIGDFFSFPSASYTVKLSDKYYKHFEDDQSWCFENVADDLSNLGDVFKQAIEYRIANIEGWLRLATEFVKSETFTFGKTVVTAKKVNNPNEGCPIKLYLNGQTKTSMSWKETAAKLIAKKASEINFIEITEISERAGFLRLKFKSGSEQNIFFDNIKVGEFDKYFQTIIEKIKSLDFEEKKRKELEAEKKLYPEVTFENIKMLSQKVDALQKQIESLRNTQNTTLIVAVID